MNTPGTDAGELTTAQQLGESYAALVGGTDWHVDEIPELPSGEPEPLTTEVLSPVAYTPSSPPLAEAANEPNIPPSPIQIVEALLFVGGPHPLPAQSRGTQRASDRLHQGANRRSCIRARRRHRQIIDAVGCCDLRQFVGHARAACDACDQTLRAFEHAVENCLGPAHFPKHPARCVRSAESPWRARSQPPAARTGHASTGS